MDADQEGAGRSGRRSNFAVLGGLGGGLGAFVLAFTLLLFLRLGRLSGAADYFTYFTSFDAVTPNSVEVLNWVFFEAHTVGTEIAIAAGGTSRSSVTHLTHGVLYEPWFSVVPILALGSVGYLLADMAYSWDLVSGLQAGASVVLGYFLGATVAVFALAARGVADGVTVTIGPDPLAGLLLAGLVYPVVFGGLGGAVAGWR